MKALNTFSYVLCCVYFLHSGDTESGIHWYSRDLMDFLRESCIASETGQGNVLLI